MHQIWHASELSCLWLKSFPAFEATMCMQSVLSIASKALGGLYCSHGAPDPWGILKKNWLGICHFLYVSFQKTLRQQCLRFAAVVLLVAFMAPL